MNTNQNPKVSIIMPAYNVAAFIEEAIEGILQQSFTDFELIIINDGSTDKTGEKVKKFADNRIKYFEQKNVGVAITLNNALALAKGEIMWRHDADDKSLPEKLGRQVEFLTRHPDVALCATQVAFMTERGFVAQRYRQPSSTYFGDASFVEVKREHFNPYSPITHGTVVARLEVIRKLGGYRTFFKTSEDIDLWLRLIQQHKAVVLNQCDYFQRLNRYSATQIHGNKNAYYRSLAFDFYDQRKLSGSDILQKGETLILQEPPAIEPVVNNKDGRLLHANLLSYYYPLNINAHDWKGSYEILKLVLADGWRLKQTYKSLLFPLIGMNRVEKIVKLKNRITPS